MSPNFPLGVDYIHYMIYDPLKEEAVGVVHKYGFKNGKPKGKTVHWFITKEEREELQAKFQGLEDLEFWRALVNYKATPQVPWTEENFKRQWHSIKIALKSDPSMMNLLVRIDEGDYNTLLSIHQMAP